MKINKLQLYIADSITAKKSLLSQEDKIMKSIEKIIIAIKKGKTVFLCGNGGSAADAQHLAAEMLVRLRPNVNRKSIPFLSLAMDTSTLTACGNDYGYDYIFSRPLEALAKKGDILIVISTSGNSQNILEALKLAKKKQIFSIGFLGGSGGKAKKYCDLPIIIQSSKTARIQESHIFLGHYILEQCERKLFNK
jgi:D-sedoheptulose 7-phosphate isomerase